jgi:hypothetical protein
MSTDGTEVRLALVARGYTPLPLHGKIPPLEIWQRLENVTREQVEMWHRHWPDARIPLPPSLDPVWQIFDTSNHKTGWRRVIIRFDGDDAE